MKKTAVILLTALGLVSFGVAALSDYSVSGTASGIENGKKVYIEKQNSSNGLIKVDSTFVQEGKFSMKGSVAEPAIHFLEVEGVKGKLAFILEGGKISFTVYKDSIGKSLVGGTSNNQDLQEFNKLALKIQSRMMTFQQANMQKMQEAQSKQDTVAINALMKTFKGFQDEMMALSADYPQKHPKSFISVLFTDNLFNNPGVDIAQIKKTYEGLDASLKNTSPGKALKARIEGYQSVEVGSAAPDFSAPSPEGKLISLKESLGKVTIVDFWASWCGPCRKENPNVVKLFADYHAKGLNIVSVSLDKEAQKWIDAIAKDGLTWVHVSNLKFWEDPIALLYQVKAIPATFVLDAKGNIIARDLRGEELRAKVASVLDH